jgi:membrane protease YdiL (CAAX protease family)
LPEEKSALFNQSKAAVRQMEWICFTWILFGLASLFPVLLFLDGSLPIFTMIWLSVPLVVVLRGRDASRVGFSAVPLQMLLRITLLNLTGLLFLAALIEPWFHPYQTLVQAALSAAPPDLTFAWLVRFPGLPGWVGMALFSGLVTIFAEELFFRGWLLQMFGRKLKMRYAILLQAVLFSLPQGIAALLLPPLQGILYFGVYSFLGIGLLNGWAAARTRSIWPGLISATLFNLFICIVTV